jgi:hypothetical protein
MSLRRLSSTLRRVDLLLVVVFVSVCVYQRTARPRQVATTPIRASVDASLRLPPRPSALASAQPIAAIGKFIGKLKSGPVGAGGATAGAATDAAFIPAMPTAASGAMSGGLATAAACQGATAETGAPCTTSLGAATTADAASSPSIRVSTEPGAQDTPAVPLSSDEAPGANRLYTEMLGGAPLVTGGRQATFDSYIATEPVSAPVVTFTPIYPWNAGLAITFVGDPSPYYIEPANFRFVDFVTIRDSGTKKFTFDKDIDRVITNGGDGSTPLVATATPEPATLTLFGTGLAAIGAVRRRRKKPATD